MGVIIDGSTSEQSGQFDQYLALLVKWNKTHNLTAIRDPKDMVRRHFLECSRLVPHLGSTVTVLDLGTGGGFPGLPIAIMAPHIQVTVLDSAHKKIVFCQEVIRACHLTNATAVLANADDPSTETKIGRFETIVSRATWALSEYLPVALRYVQDVNGTILAMKGPRYMDEISEVQSLPTHVEGPQVAPLSTVGDLHEEFVVIKYHTV